MSYPLASIQTDRSANFSYLYTNQNLLYSDQAFKITNCYWVTKPLVADCIVRTLKHPELSVWRLMWYSQIEFTAFPLFFFNSSGVGLSPLYCGLFWSIVPAPNDRWGWLWRNWWNEDWQGKPKYSEKICPSVTLSTTNPTWPDPGAAVESQRLTAWAMARPSK
jgi:hypothetical protein